VKRLLLIALVGCGGCPPSAPAVTDSQVWSSLVEAGCLNAAGSSSTDVAAEHAGPNPPWLQCLYDGGAVQACGVPCDGGGR